MRGTAVIGVVGLIVIAGCGSATSTVTTTTAASSGGSSAPAFQQGTPTPKVTADLIAQAGYGLTQANRALEPLTRCSGQ